LAAISTIVDNIPAIYEYVLQDLDSRSKDENIEKAARFALIV